MARADQRSRSFLQGALLSSLLLLPACAGLGYEPVREVSLATVLERDCGKDGERVATQAWVNKVYRNSLILWDGRNPKSTYTVNLVDPTLRQRARAKVGTSRFERAYEVLKRLERERVPIEIVLTCAPGDRPPTTGRFSYVAADGERRTFELDQS
ncbi:MAG: hypothetical protein ACLF0P_04750 [Thermoanaerobaculia bacterium]